MNKRPRITKEQAAELTALLAEGELSYAEIAVITGRSRASVIQFNRRYMQGKKSYKKPPTKVIKEGFRSHIAAGLIPAPDYSGADNGF